MGGTTCNNCGSIKPIDYYRACLTCREKWRKAKKATQRKTVPMHEMLDVLRMLQKVSDLECGPQASPVRAVLSKYKEYTKTPQEERK